MYFGVGSNGPEVAVSDLCDGSLINDDDLENELKLNKLQLLKFKRAATQYKQDRQVEEEQAKKMLPFPSPVSSAPVTSTSITSNSSAPSPPITVDCVVPEGLSAGMNFHLDMGNGRRVRKERERKIEMSYMWCQYYTF
jgi:hypothetical protein